MYRKLKLTPVNCRYGAPLGRSNRLPLNPSKTQIRLYLRKLRMVDHDYDEGGAYWGGPCKHGSMYCAFSGPEAETVQVFVRACSRSEAWAEVLKLIPNASLRSN